ncbi:hypothetical protein QBC43DRAFT_98950 [Cladorrhinum sp. PSN259]|nr:hypothetical protein QBC43DRAFT_98950 [Cladorrhinum sp. PSN259]
MAQDSYLDLDDIRVGPLPFWWCFLSLGIFQAAHIEFLVGVLGWDRITHTGYPGNIWRLATVMVMNYTPFCIRVLHAWIAAVLEEHLYFPLFCFFLARIFFCQKQLGLQELAN